MFSLSDDEIRMSSFRIPLSSFRSARSLGGDGLRDPTKLLPARIRPGVSLAPITQSAPGHQI